jgi:membrane glycosyltransferase
VLARSALRHAYGGTLRIVTSVVLEFALSMLIAPVCAVAVSLFLLGLPLGRQVSWNAQQRDAHRLSMRTAVRRLWPQTVLGCALAAGFWQVAPGAVLYWTPFVMGLAGSIPLAVVTAHPLAGRALALPGLCRVPSPVRIDEPERTA